MHRAVVAGIHHHEFPVQPVRPAKPFPPLGIPLHLRVVRPGRNHGHFRRVDSFGHDAVAHETVERDDLHRLPHAKARHPLQQPGSERPVAEPAGGDGFVRVEVHYPVEETTAAQPGQRGAQEGNQRWRGQRDHRIVPGQERHAQSAQRDETGKIRGTPPLGAFPETGRGDTIDANAAPRLVSGELRFRLVVGTPARHDRHPVTTLYQTEGDLGQILTGRHHVRVKRLVEEEEGQNGQGTEGLRDRLNRVAQRTRKRKTIECIWNGKSNRAWSRHPLSASHINRTKRPPH